MKRQTSSKSSKNSNKKTRFIFNSKDKSVLKLRWFSPNDKKENVIDFKNDFSNDNFIEIKDNH